MKIEIKKVVEGVCPYCGSADTDYGAGTLQYDGLLMYEVVCENCHRKFEEWFRPIFIGQNVGDCCDICLEPDDENIEIEIDEEE